MRCRIKFDGNLIWNLNYPLSTLFLDTVHSSDHLEQLFESSMEYRVDACWSDEWKLFKFALDCERMEELCDAAIEEAKSGIEELNDTETNWSTGRTDSEEAKVLFQELRKICQAADKRLTFTDSDSHCPRKTRAVRDGELVSMSTHCHYNRIYNHSEFESENCPECEGEIRERPEISSDEGMVYECLNDEECGGIFKVKPENQKT